MPINGANHSSPKSRVSTPKPPQMTNSRSETGCETAFWHVK